MQKLLDKLIVFGLCLSALPFTEIQWHSVVAMLAALAVSSLCGYLENRVPAILCALYAGACLFIPELAVFLPLVVYDCAAQDKGFIRFCWVAALPGYFLSAPATAPAAVLFCGAAFLLQYRTAAAARAHEALFALTDSAKETAASLERENRELAEKQGYEVRLATLAERNRIAREIHDNVGHLLTRSLLQLGALRVTQTGDGGLTKELDTVTQTLSGAMDSIRRSVHDLHDESVDLEMQLGAMIDGFSFCPVTLRYDAGDLPGAIKTCFAAVAREALSNIARHSNATEAAITVTEHPAFCRMVVQDNGTARPGKGQTGIGLQNMASRLDALGGIFRAEYAKGFRVFVSAPKQNQKQEGGVP